MKDVIIVGSFKQNKNGSTGGVAAASSALLNSALSEQIRWIKIDSTGKIPVESIFLRGLKAFWRIVKLLYLMCTKWSVDTVLIFVSDGASFVEKGTMVILANAFGKKAILAPRSGYLPGQIERNHLFRKYVMHILKKSDTVVCQGYFWKRYFLDLTNLSDDKFVIIHNWVDTVKYHLPIRSSHNTGYINLLYIGWLTEQKGILDLVEAVNGIKGKMPNLRVHIGGDGPDRDSMIQKIEESGLEDFFVFHGWVDYSRKMELYSEADFFILPSQAEGFPNSLLEAMAVGLPVVASNVGAVEDLVTRESGIIVTPSDISEIAKALLLMYENKELREKAGIESRLRVEKLFSINAAISSFERILL